MKLPENECRARFQGARVLRLATADAQAQPHLVAATFAVVDNAVAIAIDHKPKRSTNLKRLRNITENPKVSLLVDHYDDDWANLWWVRADGLARVVDAGDAAEHVSALVDKYSQYREHRPVGDVIMITVKRWSGWSAANG